MNAHTQPSSAVRVCGSDQRVVIFLDNPSRQLAPDACEGVGPDLHSSHLSVNENDSDSYERERPQSLSYLVGHILWNSLCVFPELRVSYENV